MLRKLIFVLLPVVLLGAACSGGSGDSATKSTPQASTPVRDGNGDGIYDPSQPTDVSSDTPAAPSPAIEIPSDTPADVAIPTATGADSTRSGATLFGALSPFDLLDAASGDVGTGAEADPALAQVLLDVSDLPDGFTKLEESTHTVPNKLGDLSVTLNAFTSGDLESGGFGAVVGSATMRMPQAALDEFERAGGFDALRNLSEADLRDVEPEAQQLGIGYRDVHGLDGSGLGDAGGGFHMVIDMGALIDMFGPETPEPNPFDGGIAYDMYLFLRGDQLFVVMVIWPADHPSGVDSRSLAETLDAKAEGAGF